MRLSGNTGGIAGGFPFKGLPWLTPWRALIAEVMTGSRAVAIEAGSVAASSAAMSSCGGHGRQRRFAAWSASGNERAA